MGKVIFWIVVFFLVLLALRLVSVYKARDEARDETPDNARRPDSKTPSTQRDTTPAQDSMVKCAECGVFVPKANAIMKTKGWSCSDAHCGHRR